VRALEPRWTGGTPVDPASVRAAYLHGRFVGLNGRRVLWGEATVEDHNAHIEFLASLRNGITRTIEAHEGAIADIVACPGATCLNDLPAVRPGDEDVA
jgi:hypothetical protein